MGNAARLPSIVICANLADVKALTHFDAISNSQSSKCWICLQIDAGRNYRHRESFEPSVWRFGEPPSVMHSPRNSPGLVLSYAVAADARRCWKHSRQYTGRPCVGLNGTVVSLPHWLHIVRVSTFGYEPAFGAPTEFARFDLHALQRLGSFLNCLS